MTRPRHASLAPILALALELTLSGPAAAEDVRAADYDAFWLWAGVAPQAVLVRARSLYILQGQVEAPRNDEAAVNLIAQGGATPRLHRGEVWLVYRAHTLNWTPAIYAKLRARLDRWRRADNPVVGVQIDFDARTRHLDEYARFLRDLRARMPADCRLSITGLLDWSSQGDPAGLAALGGVVDEVVLQTYQGRRTITGLWRLSVPHWPRQDPVQDPPGAGRRMDPASGPRHRSLVSRLCGVLAELGAWLVRVHKRVFFNR